METISGGLSRGLAAVFCVSVSKRSEFQDGGAGEGVVSPLAAGFLFFHGMSGNFVGSLIGVGLASPAILSSAASAVTGAGF